MSEAYHLLIESGRTDLADRISNGVREYNEEFGTNHQLNLTG